MSSISLTVTLPGSAAPQNIFVTRGWLRMRDRGNWTAYLESSNTVAPAEGSPATVNFARTDGVTVDAFVGTVRRAAVNPGNSLPVVTVVGGAGKLLAQLPPLDHVYGGTTIPAGVVARAICDAAGEQLAPGIEAALDATALPRWHRASDITAATALDLLADYLGMPWRMLPSGLVSIAAETWPTNDNAAYWMNMDGDDGGAFYAPDGAPLIVGQSIDGARAIDVRYDFDDTNVTCEVRSAVTGDPPHRPDLDLYRGSWPAKVIEQNDDGTIDVTCDDPRMGDVRSVPVRLGFPGSSLTLDMTQPTRVRVRFEGASPAGAFAESFDQDPAATLPVALATGYLYAEMASGGIVALYWSPFQGAPSGSPAWTPIAFGPTPPGPSTQGTPIAFPSAQVRLR